MKNQNRYYQKIIRVRVKVMSKLAGKIALVVLLSFFLQSCSSVRQSQELQLGKNDFGSGDYKKSFHELLPLAAEGNPEAEYAVGYMYYYGLGVTQDAESGSFWMKKSAAHKYEPAVKALEMIK